MRCGCGTKFPDTVSTFPDCAGEGRLDAAAPAVLGHKGGHGHEGVGESVAELCFLCAPVMR